VKIRGFRVEPGEIETILLGHPAVAEAVVEAQDFGSGDRRLVAYIVSRAETAITGGDVRRYLQARMPDYLVPTYVIPVDALPIMPNGKIDRRALPVPGPNRPDLGHPVLQPQTPIEHILAQVWEEVLKVDEVGIADNFFELGGDSLLSMQMIARARQHGIVLKSEDLIDRPTIAELAASAASGAGVVIADQGTVEGPVPLVPSQLQYLEEDHPVAQWIERTVLELKRPLHSGLLEEALASVLAHHDVLRARFTRAGDQWKQTILAAEERRTFSAFDVRRASELHAHGGMPAVEMEARGEIDITSGPLVRALHLARIHKPSRLILYIHHLVVDAYSIPILVQDLETAYLQLERGQTVRLPPKTTSFRVWSERLLDYAGSDSLRRQIDYWAGIGERARSLPFALSARESSTGHLQYVTARLSSGETETLVRGIPRTRGVQLTDLLLTALALAFRRWAGSEHLIVRLSVHGREAPFDDMDVSRTAGWFATEFPFLLNPGAAADPLDALAAVTEQLRRIPDGGLGYGVLRYLCPDDGPAARLCALPPVSVSLNYQGRPDHLLEESSLFTIRKKANTQPPPDTVPLSYRLPVTAQIHSGQLYLRVRFHDEAYKESDIQSVMSHIVEALRALVHAAPVAAGQ
jgi:non-ribosomal peptide synthase protein (TIGR01720 family)